MYVQESVISSYKKLVNQEKIQGLSERELLFKINKCLDLGRKVFTYSDGSYLVQYYDLVFKCEGFRCVKVYRDSHNKPYIISGKAKKQYMEELMEDIA